MRNRPHTLLLLLFAGLFAFRVVAQLIQEHAPTAFLPPAEAWQGSALPYPALLACQIAILVVMASLISAVWTGQAQPNPKAGRGLLIVGLSYFSIMLLRLVAGLTFAADHDWFALKLPSFFHLVLAAFVLTLAHFHLRGGDGRTGSG